MYLLGSAPTDSYAEDEKGWSDFRVVLTLNLFSANCCVW